MGINLLREGLDLPEVSLVAILDVDKEDSCAAETALVQTIGRAARNAGGQVIMYADSGHPLDGAAIRETEAPPRHSAGLQPRPRHRPKTIIKAVRDVIEISKKDTDDAPRGSAPRRERRPR